MRKFIINTAILCIISITIFLIILCNANGYTDASYINFTTPKQHSLILGTSRAAQGLQPQVFKQLLDLDIYNYSFNIGESPYGPVYLESIKKKLDHDSGKDGVFIITVDPWGISSINQNPNDISKFRENERALGNMHIVDSKPNFQYLFNNMAGDYAKIITNLKGKVFLHENGWLEVSVGMDPDQVADRMESKVESYLSNLSVYRYSSVRFEYLNKTIKYLGKYGKVYLVRLPVHDKIMEIENTLMPDFNEKIKELVPWSNGYFDMTPLNMNFEYTDGNHLYKDSARLVTEKIANWIKEQEE